MVTVDNYTYHEHFVIHIMVESLYYIPETNAILHIIYYFNKKVILNFLKLMQ